MLTELAQRGRYSPTNPFTLRVVPEALSPLFVSGLLLDSEARAGGFQRRREATPAEEADMASSAFAGTTQKCTACGKTVYLVDQLVADTRFFHRACFRCQHCKGTLKLSNYSSFEGVLYCKPHYDQLFKMTGSLNKSFEGAPRYAKVEKHIDRESQTSSRISSVFVGTQDKCVVCGKTVYPIEKVAVDGNSYHRPCFKCSHGGCTISPSNYMSHEGKLYCKHHHNQLFKSKGNFSQLEEKHEEIRARVKMPEPEQNGRNHTSENGTASD